MSITIIPIFSLLTLRQKVHHSYKKQQQVDKNQTPSRSGTIRINHWVKVAQFAF
jgi:hypothetical protein